MGGKRLDIKTGFICNNNCRFCVQADNKCKGNRGFEEIKKDLIDCRGRCDAVVLTGGEVTIRKDFFDIVSLAKDLNYKTIQIQTNGRMFASLDFCKKTIKAGATEFSPALHGHNEQQHDYLTRVLGSFNQTVKGIKNLKSLGAYILTNTVITKTNYTNCQGIAQLLVNLNVDQFQFAFIHPMGNAWKNFDKIVPHISSAVRYIHKGLKIGIDANKQVMAEAVPYCLMQGYEDYIAEKIIPETEIRGKKYQNTNNFTRLRKNQGKTKFPQCKRCKFDNICEGPWKEYAERRGDVEFKPRPFNIINKNLVLKYVNTIKKRGISTPKLEVKEGNGANFYWISGMNLETYCRKYPEKYGGVCKRFAQIQGKIHEKAILSIGKVGAKKAVINLMKNQLENQKQTLRKLGLLQQITKILECDFPKEFIPDLIHGDLWFNNVIINKGRQYLIDFENVCPSFLEIDILDNAFIHGDHFLTEYKNQNPRTNRVYENFTGNLIFYKAYFILRLKHPQRIKKMLPEIARKRGGLKS